MEEIGSEQLEIMLYDITEAVELNKTPVGES